MSAARVTVDASCGCQRCTSRTLEKYEMQARCTNCGTLATVLYRKGDPSAVAKCPNCECRTLSPFYVQAKP